MSSKRIELRGSGRIIDFLDLGSGDDFRRAGDIAGRKVGTGSRRVVAVDRLKAFGMVPPGLEYVRSEAVDFLKGLKDASVRVIGADNFFHDPSRFEHLRNSDAKRNALIADPIDLELLRHVKRVLVPNGRIYGTTVKWHCDLLLAKLQEHGFTVTARPVSDMEAEASTTSRLYHPAWKAGQFYTEFGKEGWRLYRFSAIKRK